jgi:hypothetical protein
MDLPIALALAVGLIRGAINTIIDSGPIYFDGLALLIFALLVGRFLQQRGQRMAADAAELLHAIAPVSARVVDAQGIHELRTMFVDLVREGTTIMLSSHLLAEVELICTRAAMMSSGRIVAQDDVAALLAPTGWVRITTPDIERALRTLQDGPFGYQQVAPDLVRVNMGDRPPELLNRAFVQSDIRVRELVVERPTLEDVFLECTGHGDIR